MEWLGGNRGYLSRISEDIKAIDQRFSNIFCTVALLV